MTTVNGAFAIFTAMANSNAGSRIGIRRYYLKEWREALGVKQQDIATRLGVSKTVIYRWENWEPDNENTRLPSINDIIAYADALGTEPAFLMMPPERADAGARVSALPPELQAEVTKYVAYLESQPPK